MNALKYTSQGYIEITYEVKEAAVILSVTDTGCGIPSDKLNKVFDRFEKQTLLFRELVLDCLFVNR